MIERAGPFHPACLAAIHATAFPPEESWSASMIAGHLTMPGVFGFLHDEHGMILVRIAADEAEILTLAVAPEARRRGMARGLLLAAAHHAYVRGAVRLLLEVAETNQAARNLYTGLGFKTVGKRPCYYANRSDALLLRADLPISDAAAHP